MPTQPQPGIFIQILNALYAIRDAINANNELLEDIAEDNKAALGDLIAAANSTNQQLTALNQGLQTLIAEEAPEDVAQFAVQTTKPTPQGAQQGDTEMAGKVASLGASVSQAMLDDQQDVMTITPLNSQGQQTALPSGSAVPTYAASPGTAVTLNPSSDPTGLSCQVLGVKGQSGTETVTASFTNADGTVATGTAVYTITIDPAELDVASFGVSTSTPVAQ